LPWNCFLAVCRHFLRLGSDLNGMCEVLGFPPPSISFYSYHNESIEFAVATLIVCEPDGQQCHDERKETRHCKYQNIEV